LREQGISLFLWSTARWGPWGTWQHRSSPLGEAEPRAMGHVAASEPTSIGRQDPELRNTWQCRSSPLREAEPGAMGHVAAPEPTYRQEAKSRAEEHMAASELNSARRRGPGPRDTWQHRSPPRQEGEVRGCRTRGSTGAHLDREERSGATGYVAARGCTSCSLS
jgi:hypothetical protein